MGGMNIGRNLRITSTIFMSFLLVGMVPLIIIGYTGYEASKTSQEKEIFKKLIAISDRQGEEIESFGKEKLRDLKAFSRMPSIIEVMKDFNENFRHGTGSQKYAAVEQKYRILLEEYKKIYGFHDILFMNMNGDIIFSLAREKDLGTNLETGPYRDTGLAYSYSNAKNLEKVSISDLKYYNPSRKPAAFISIPVFSKERNDKTVGVVAIQLTAKEIKSVVNNYAGLGETGETVVGQKAGSNFVFVTGLRHDPDAAFKIEGEMGADAALPMQHALLQESGSGLTVDYRGIEVLAVWKYLPLWQWGMVVKIDASEAFEPVRDYQHFMWVIVLTTLFGNIVIAFLVARIISKPILELADMTEKIADGNLEIRAEERGTNEIGALAMSINIMTDNLVTAIRHRDNEIDERQKFQEDADRNAERLRLINAELEGKIEKLNKSRKAMVFMVADVNRISRHLEAVNTELESFSYSVSHDLRSPLRALDGFSRALQEDYSDKIDAEGKDYLNRICSASQRMGLLIDDLLGLSRITRRKMEVVTNVDLSQIAKACLEELKESEPERQNELKIDEQLIVSGDSHLLRIMLQNLLNNAWKFTAKKPLTKITFGTIDIKGEKVCFIRDNGAGFDMEYADKLFGAFQRLHPSKEFDGIGIGLATVKRIINRHGGSIWVEAKVDEGATFFFTLRQS
jgi:signal transduction histidine kinase